MKTHLSTRAWFVMIAASVCQIGYAADKPASAKPDIKFDNAPIASGSGCVVTSYADVVEPVQKAVVSVYSTKIVRERMRIDPRLRPFFGDNAPTQQRKEEGIGSGVIVAPNGYILTNNHVVAGADELKVSLTDGREFLAKVIGADEKTDVAVIKIDVENLPVVVLADSDKLRVGDVVFAVGNPLGVGQTVTMGIVSATGRNDVGILNNDEIGGYENFIQTDAAINQGNSGGALVDAQGRLIGLNSAILSQSGGSIGIGFAVPTNLAVSILNSLVTTGKVQRGYLGVAGQNLDPKLAESLGVDRSTKGVVISDVIKNSPAAKAGLKRNDIITTIAGRSVDSQLALRLIVAQVTPGTEVKVSVLRDGRERTFNITLANLDDQAGAAGELIPGVKVDALDDELRAQFKIDKNLESGVVVTEVADDSAYSSVFVPGLVIVEVNRRPVGDLKSASAALKPGLNALLVYYRGILRYVTINIK